MNKYGKGRSEMKNFISFIKKYPTRDFIYLFSKISIEIYKKQLKHNEEDIETTNAIGIVTSIKKMESN